MKILFLPNWKVQRFSNKQSDVQAPDQYFDAGGYWFFRYFSQPCHVDVLDIQQPNFLSRLEKKLNIYLWQGIKAFFVAKRYDIIVSHGAQSGLFFSLLLVLFFRRNCRHLIFDIGAMNGGRQHWLETALIRFALLSRPYVICHSKVILEGYKTRFPTLVERAIYIPFGVDTEMFSEDHRPDPEYPYVLSFGTAKRDYQTLLAAWPRLVTNCQLVIIGVDTFPAQEGVRFIRKVSLSELKAWISGAQLVVIPLPVYQYSYGQMSFLQSMSMGKTVVVTKTPSSEDYIQDGHGAWLVKPGDIKDMQQRLMVLLSQPEQMIDDGKRAAQYVRTFFDEKQMACLIEQFLIEHVIAEKPIQTSQASKTYTDESTL